MSLLDGAATHNMRLSDPETSRIAADSIPSTVLSAQRKRVLWAVVELHARNRGHGATAAEIVMRLSYTGERVPQQSVVARRLTDLRERGLVEDRGETRPGTTSRPLICWCPTDAGREALA